MLLDCCYFTFNQILCSDCVSQKEDLTMTKCTFSIVTYFSTFTAVKCLLGFICVSGIVQKALRCKIGPLASASEDEKSSSCSNVTVALTASFIVKVMAGRGEGLPDT